MFVYTWYKNPKITAVYIEDIPHHVCLHKRDLSIPAELIEWCDINCSSKWGWYYRETSPYIGFADPNEKLLFCLTNNY